MNERLKKLRKALDLTQQEFADKIGMKRNTIANYETDRNEPSNSVVSLICREFGVSEEWLRTGVGEMFELIDEDEQIAALLGQLSGMMAKDGTEFQKALMIKIMKCMLNNTEEDWKPIKRFIKELAEIID